VIAAGTSVGDYTVQGFLDAGGMAHVYEAVHSSGTRHAIKVLHATNPEVRKRLSAEGRMLMRLQHPNIVAVTDVIEIEGVPALVMELVEGPALDTWINDEPRTWPERKTVFKGLMAGMAEAHSRGVVHRDLQPANILVERDAQGNPVARIIDFGLAKNMRQDSMTQTGSTLGTPGYMSPEQIRDSKNIDARSDIFALGCLLYVLVTEMEPFDGEDNLEVFNNTCDGKYADPEPLAAPEVDRSYIRAIEGCLRINLEDRIPHAQALEDVILGGELPPPSEDFTLQTDTVRRRGGAGKGRPTQAQLWLMSIVAAAVLGSITWILMTG